MAGKHSYDKGEEIPKAMKNSEEQKVNIHTRKYKRKLYKTKKN